MFNVQCPKCSETFVYTKLVDENGKTLESAASKPLLAPQNKPHCPYCNCALKFTGVYMSIFLSMVYLILVHLFVDQALLKFCLSFLTIVVGIILMKKLIRPHAENV